MTNFRFISDEQIRIAVERDKKELDICIEHQACKSALVLAGSIIEAILVDYFLAFPRSNTTSEQVLKETLSNLIDWAEQDHLISKSTKEISTVIRGYRNLIHPGKEYRLKEKVDINSATVAAKLVEIVTQEIAENYAKRLGYTAEQAVNKVKLDPSCVSLFPHIISKMARIERIKLFKSIPDDCAYDDNIYGETVESFIKLHQSLKGNIPEEILNSEVQQVYERIHNSSRRDALFFLRFFNDDLNLLEPDQKESVISYLFSILEKGNSDDLDILYDWRIFTPVGKQFTEKDLEKLKNIVFRRLQNSSNEGNKEFLRVFSEQVLSSVSYKDCGTLIAKIREAKYLRLASEWADYIEQNQEFPF